VNTSGLSRETASQINAVTLFLFMLLQPVAGALSDRIGRKPLMIGFGVLGVLGTYPIFSALETVRDPLSAGLLVMAGLVIVTGYTSINAVVKAELFPAHIRALGVALPYGLGTAIFGGTAEAIATWFRTVDNERGFYVYVAAGLAVAFCVIFLLPDNRKHSLILED
jgi:MHS family alpha-ketoglutarate permease-like MFS transporter